MPSRAEPRHGTLERYVWPMDPCRLACCRAASAKSRAIYVLRELRGEPSTKVDTGPARRLVKAYIAKGMTQAEIARLADIPRHNIARLMAKVGSPRYVKRIDREVERRIRSVKFDRLERLHGVDSTGFRRMLEALILGGWEIQVISQKAGVSDDVLSRALNNPDFTVSVPSRDKIRRFYNDNWDVDGGSPRSRRRGLERGYAPAAAWDKGTIDDPNVAPYSGKLDPGILDELEWLEGDRRAQLLFLAERGVLIRDAGRYLGVSPQTMRNRMRKYGVVLTAAPAGRKPGDVAALRFNAAESSDFGDIIPGIRAELESLKGDREGQLRLMEKHDVLIRDARLYLGLSPETMRNTMRRYGIKLPAAPTGRKPKAA